MTNTNTLKSVYLVLVVLSGIFFFASALIASAETYDVEAEKRMAEQSLEADKKASEAEFEAIKREEEALKKDLEDLDLDEDDDSDDTDIRDDENKSEGDEHRSRVAEFVLGLKELANKDSGIGAEVREIAKEQEESKEKVAEAIEEVEKRNAFLTFLIGSDYDNLGELRSSIATLENQIDRLGKTKEKTTEEVKTELEKQIDALEEEKNKVETFVEENESKFSLFGWFVKIFD